MAHIKFNNEETCAKANAVRMSDNVVRIITESEPNATGFRLFLDPGMKYPLDNGEYESYITLYRTGEGWYELSNDGSVYVAPLPTIKFIASNGGVLTGELEQKVSDYSKLVIPEVKTLENFEFIGWSSEIPTEGVIESDKTFTALFNYIPTLAELKTGKIQEAEATKNMLVAQGFDATLTDGSVEHFSLGGEDLVYLTALQTQVIAGAESIPWHVSDDSIACKYYSNADMSIITQTAMSILVYHVTYLKDISRYINAIETKEELEAVQYGMILPTEYMSEPLRNMLAQMNG